MRGSLLIMLGSVAWIVAIFFASMQTITINGPVVPPAGSGIAPVQRYEAVNITGAAASFGFAIAGGLCFHGSAVAARRDEEKK